MIQIATQVHRHEVSDREWEYIKGYLVVEQPESQPKKRGRPSSDARKMLNGILWISKTGAMWRNMPERYGPYTTVYGWYEKWQEDGTLESIFKALAVDADLQDMSLDSTSAKVHQSASGAKKGLMTEQTVLTTKQ